MTTARPWADLGAAPDASQSLSAGESEMWRALREARDPDLREAVFVRYLPYARAVAAQLYAGRHRDDVEFKDFQQLSCIGLLESIDRFDPDRGVAFETFCTQRLKGSILSGVKKLTDGQEQISFTRRVRRERIASLKLSPEEGEDKRRDALKSGGTDTLQMLGALAAGLAIGFMLDDTGMVASPDESPAPYGTAYHGVAWRQTKERLIAAVGLLPERTRKIIHYHYFHGLCFEQIGDILGISKGRISQLHRAALAELRERLGDSQQMHLIG
ncbi:sigma-70 family RNA polymerase sigma factor [Trinickia terrae]|uniref:Sigma-70 family RNA polymerase sigma factor n=1 Tax=Trinickia terrae TaxID=2571161 RepID=A0A4U1I7Q2_9BURK|nr:sigma-70 family RNA polymerase sigma factor [Trinickia terrae]TKC89451.1 sigma-70 family RNA polymerase sigma factor [Trinickia terrae]